MKTVARLRRWLLAGLLVASLAANALLAHWLLDVFKTLQFVRVFPLGYSMRESLGESVAPRPSIAFWGDSRAAAWAESDAMRARSALNFAHGGQTSSQLVLQLRTTPARHTDFAVVQIGINDLHPLGALPAQREEILARLRENIAAICELLRERSDTVVFTTIVPPGPTPLMRRVLWDPETARYVREVNALIRRSADARRVVVLDAAALLGEEDGHLPVRFTDPDFFLHFNSTAYALLDDRLQQLLALPDK
ncbi:MAG TPA: SGNH/GDSL hydrolase family protein [Burkholderiaceae bacterium]|nr:SGNH/GDSL hydrolase family protein [Burkholderiaceae bacterium]